MPAMAPYTLERLQKRANSITGPKAAPKPAHANEIMTKIELSGSLAMNAAMAAITITADLAIIMPVFSESLMSKHSFMRFSVTLEEATRSCESEVDMVAARMPERTTPAIKELITPVWLRSCAIRMMIVSDALPSSAAISPLRDRV